MSISFRYYLSFIINTGFLEYVDEALAARGIAIPEERQAACVLEDSGFANGTEYRFHATSQADAAALRHTIEAIAKSCFNDKRLYRIATGAVLA